MRAKELLKSMERSIDNAIDKGLRKAKETKISKMYSAANGSKEEDVGKRLKYGAHIGGLSAIGGMYGIASLKDNSGSNNKKEVLQ